MKDKILEALKTKYKNLGFGEKELETVADMLVGRVKDETEIETAVAGVENLLKAFQGGLDKVRTEKTNTDKKLAELQEQINKLSGKGGDGGKTEPKTPTGKPEEGKSGTGDGANPETAALLAAIQKLEAKIEGIQTEKVTESRKTRLETVLKNAPALTKLAFKNTPLDSFESEEKFTEWITEVETGVKEEIAAREKEGLPTGVPVGGSKVPANEKKVKEATPEEVQALSKAMGIRKVEPKM